MLDRSYRMRAHEKGDIMGYWMRGAERELARGVTEVSGAGNNPRILEYHRACTSWQSNAGPSQDETDWCSSFINWVMRQGGYIGSQSAGARSWLRWGVACEQQYGAITVLKNPSHVGFFYDNGPGSMVALLGGNQRVNGQNRVCIKSYPRARVAGYRWPAQSIVPVRSTGRW